MEKELCRICHDAMWVEKQASYPGASFEGRPCPACNEETLAVFEGRASVLPTEHEYDDGFNEDALWEQHLHDRQERRDGWQPAEVR